MKHGQYITAKTVASLTQEQWTKFRARISETYKKVQLCGVGEYRTDFGGVVILDSDCDLVWIAYWATPSYVLDEEFTISDILEFIGEGDMTRNTTGIDAGHSEMIDLVNTRGVKIKIVSKSHSEQVQRLLFSIGCGWYLPPQNETRHTDARYLYCCQDGIIAFREDEDNYKNSTFQEVELFMTLRKVQDKIDIGGELYNLSDVIHALAIHDVKPVR